MKLQINKQMDDTKQRILIMLYNVAFQNDNTYSVQMTADIASEVKMCP